MRTRSNSYNPDPYIDEVIANSSLMGAAAKLKSANINPNFDALEDTKAASATDGFDDFDTELDTEDLVEGDREFEHERDLRSDDFSSYDPYKDRQREKNKDGQEQEQRKERRLGKIKRKEAPEPTREEVFRLLDTLDNVIATELDNDKQKKSVDEEFRNWNNWFKPQKKEPPKPDPAKVFYIREEYNKQRSPHLWKSNPDRKWILAFGNNKVNNHVSTNLYKYQNATISKDA